MLCGIWPCLFFILLFVDLIIDLLADLLLNYMHMYCHLRLFSNLLQACRPLYQNPFKASI